MFQLPRFDPNPNTALLIRHSRYRWFRAPATSDPYPACYDQVYRRIIFAERVVEIVG